MMVGWRVQVWYCGWEIPWVLLLGFPKISIPKPDPHGKDITQQESLGTDIL